jgi:D-alanyl-D-alanine dipeptidase
MRYAGANNFMGRPIAGYQANECIVTREVASRLKAAQTSLRSSGLSLKMLDCYRPARASRDMVAWSRDGNETAADRRFNPHLNKADLFRLGYIAEYSGHSTGHAVDLTLIRMGATNEPKFDAARQYADCTAPAAQRAPEDSIDMGTGYDCSDAKAFTASPAVSSTQRQMRQRLVGVMAKAGFVNYSKEWWHFAIPGGPRVAYDFPIRPRPGR